jgi:hypothetical protein
LKREAECGVENEFIAVKFRSRHVFFYRTLQQRPYDTAVDEAAC